ncbi:hypothetical protein [Pedobacter agri]|uniref:DUF3108 domain-containing protein n=1 Tax=Pedobacter agri TaxID=454586 RepID=UPI0029319847|nr:hypothetical protein [Pedobacter agri]
MNPNRLVFTLIFCFIALKNYSQQSIVPKNNIVESKWIHNTNYEMKWTMLRDTNRLDIGTVKTNVIVSKKDILVVTAVHLKGATAGWIDSTIVKKTDLSPVYHSSFNAQRDMIIYFGKTITGYYHDKKTGEKKQISEQVAPGYFDSNFYPMLINWLPLNLSLKTDIAIFDYNPNGKTGLMKASILSVAEGVYQSKKIGKRSAWIVEVKDEIGGANGATSFYYIDKLTRQLYKQEISAGNRKMEMTLLE